MPKFIKLTGPDGTVGYVNIDKIVSFAIHEHGHTEILISEFDDVAPIKETPEEILKLIAECED